MISQTKICETCGIEFVKPRDYSHSQWDERKFCSLSCMRHTSEAKARMSSIQQVIARDRGPRFIDMIGEKFSRLTVTNQAGRTKSRAVKWLCLCECGNTTTATRQALISGMVKSCGCHKSDRMKLLTGDLNAKWVGDNVGYGALHSWINNEKNRAGQSKTGTCVECGASPGPSGKAGTQWANISGQYLRDIDDFRELCPRCNSAEKKKSP